MVLPGAAATAARPAGRPVRRADRRHDSLARPVLQAPDIEDYVRQMAATLAQLHRVPIDRLTFLPDQVEPLSASLSQRTIADDALEPGLRQTVLAAWPSVSVAPTRRTLVHGDYWPGTCSGSVGD